MRIQHKWLFAALVSLGILVPSSSPSAQLGFAAAGPVNPINGFPAWYRDTRGLSLDACLTDPILCGLAAPVTLSNPGQAFPLNFGTTFPDEFFYNRCIAKMPTANGGQALLVIALEGAFLNGPVAAGDQMTFGRVRIRVSGTTPGRTYDVTTPLGAFRFVATLNVPGINSTDDIGGVFGGDFTTALGSHAGPFLTWDVGLPVLDAAGREYVGNPAIDHTITGSPTGRNFFRVDGPSIGGPGVNRIQTNLFSVTGLKTPPVVQPPPPPAAGLVLQEPVPGRANAGNTFTVTGTSNNGLVFLLGSLTAGSSTFNQSPCGLITTGLAGPKVLANTRAVGTTATFRVSINGSLLGLTFNTQAVDLGKCAVSNVNSHVY